MIRRKVAAFSVVLGIATLVLPTWSASAATVTSGSCTATVNDASGVSISVNAAGECVLVFATAPTTPTTNQSSTSRTWTVPASVSSVDVFIVGGGGGGGMSNGSVPTGGGGGGGGIVAATSYSVTPSSSITITTGAGGQGGNCSPGNPGGNSTFGSLIAAGGGFGGGCGPAYGGPGGSAGGAHWGQPQGLAGQPTLGTPSNGSNIQSYGGNGGKSYPHGQAGDGISAGGGGGGGATTNGSDAMQPGDVSTGIGGNGGEGLANNWRTDSNVIYGAGGGGQGRAVQGIGGTNAGTASGTNAAGGAGIDAVDTTGAGGGGGYRQGGGRAGDGGSGIVIVKFVLPSAPSNSNAPTISGTAQIGETLTATTGTWVAIPTATYTYQWKRASTVNGTYTNISSATNNAYVLTSNDVGKFIKVEVTATNSSGSLAALSSATSVILNYTTTTTTPAVTTTSPPVVEIVIQAPTTTAAPVVQQGNSGIVATTIATRSTIPQTDVAAAVRTTPTPATTTTSTVAPTKSAPTPPNIPSVDTGQAAVQLGEQTTTANIRREQNQIVVSAGELSATLAALNTDGNVSPLDGDGNLRLLPGQTIRISMNGFQPNSTIDAWIFSTPVLLGSAKVDATGKVSATFAVSDDVPTGAHRIAVLARLRDGKKASFTLGIAIGNFAKERNMAVWVIATPVVLAVLSALFLPAVYRRRRKVHV